MNDTRVELAALERAIETLFVYYGTSEETADLCAIVRGYLELEEEDRLFEGRDKRVEALMVRALNCLECPARDRRKLLLRLRVVFGRIRLIGSV